MLPLAALAVLCGLAGFLWVLSAGVFALPFDLAPLVAIAVLGSILTFIDTRIGLGLLIFAIGSPRSSTSEGSRMCGWRTSSSP